MYVAFCCKAIAAPIGKVFPKSRTSFLGDEPDETLNLTAKSLVDKSFIPLAQDNNQPVYTEEEEEEEEKSYDYNDMSIVCAIFSSVSISVYVIH